MPETSSDAVQPPQELDLTATPVDNDDQNITQGPILEDEQQTQEEQQSPLQVQPTVDTRDLTKLEKAIEFRDKLEALIRRTAQTKKNCEKLEHDNKYLQEYVGNLMNSGEFLSKKL